MTVDAFKSFSKKQLILLNWWTDSSPYKNRDAIICDGSVRSGKTVCMFLSFIFWAFYMFSDSSFAVCGKTITSLRRNIITPMLLMLRSLGFTYEELVSKNMIIIKKTGEKTVFTFSEVRMKRSAALIQGMTLSGVMLDETALMPRSFCEQAIARCSVDNSRLWFNCNPENPAHWFYTEWIKKAVDKNCLYLHFTMDDNPRCRRRLNSVIKIFTAVHFTSDLLKVNGSAVTARFTLFRQLIYIRRAGRRHEIFCFLRLRHGKSDIHGALG